MWGLLKSSAGSPLDTTNRPMALMTMMMMMMMITTTMMGMTTMVTD